MVFPFEHLNLRFNPFGELDPEQRAAVAVVDHVQLGPGVTQVVGAPGRGKTTFLLVLHSRYGLRPRACEPSFREKGQLGCSAVTNANDGFRGVVFCRMGESRPMRARQVGELLRLESDTFLLVDEAQLLERRLLKRLCNRFSTVVLGTHFDLSLRCRCDSMVVLQGLDPDVLEVIVRRRIELARRGPGPVPVVSAHVLSALIELYDDDLRAIVDHLYELFQHQMEPVEIHVDFDV